MKSFYLSIIIFSICWACSNSKYEFSKYEAVNEAGWQATDTLVYKINIEDINATYNVNIGVRHNKDYEFSNIWFKVLGNIAEDTQNGDRFEVQLFDKFGKPYGKSTGSLCTQIVPLKKNYKFSKKGIHTIKIIQLMRQDPLLGVKDVGILLEQSK